MNTKNEQELERLIREEGVTAEQVRHAVHGLAKNVEGFMDFNKIIFTMLIMEKSSSATSSLHQIDTRQIQNVISKMNEELPEFLLAYTSFLRFRSFCKWGLVSSFIFTISGLYLSLMNYLSIGLGGPLIILFALLSFVFSSRLFHLRKFSYGI